MQSSKRIKVGNLTTALGGILLRTAHERRGRAPAEPPTEADQPKRVAQRQQSSDRVDRARLLNRHAKRPRLVHDLG
jgi:hypothetical protein